MSYRTSSRTPILSGDIELIRYKCMTITLTHCQIVFETDTSIDATRATAQYDRKSDLWFLEILDGDRVTAEVSFTPEQFEPFRTLEGHEFTKDQKGFVKITVTWKE